MRRVATLRNVFDQYSQPENRLTHALAVFLNEEPRALREFLHLLGATPPKSARLQVLEQRVPGEQIELTDDEITARGLPDMWIQDEAGEWAVLVESKVGSTLSLPQLRRHREVGRQRGVHVERVGVITLAESADPGLPWTGALTWSRLYAWARGWSGRSAWASRFAEFLEIMEQRMTATNQLSGGTLTEFSGVAFDTDTPYDYGAAKRIIRLMTRELRRRKDLSSAGVDTDHEGRSAIKGGTSTLVWDYLPLKAARGRGFTKAPHVSYSLNRDRVHAAVTIPHNLARGPLRNLEENGFLELLRRCAQELLEVCRRSGEGARPTLELSQRHFRSRGSSGTQDAQMVFDLRTLVRRPKSKVKVEEDWARFAYELWRNRSSNMQMGVGADFPYGPATQDPGRILDVVAGTWLACRPLWEAAWPRAGSAR